MPRTWLSCKRDGPDFGPDETYNDRVLVEYDGAHVTLTVDRGDEFTFKIHELRAALGIEEQGVAT